MALCLVISYQSLISLDWEISEVVNHGGIDCVIVCPDLVLQLLDDLGASLAELIQLAQSSCLF